MRSPVLPLLLAAAALHPDASAQQPGPAVTQLQVQAGSEVAELSCEAQPQAPAARAPAAPNPDPMEIPAADLIQSQDAPEPAAAPLPALRPVAVKDAQRIAIWGDSHLAAGFFSDELRKLLKFPPEAVPDVRIPANMGRAGVRLPLRKSCVSAQWKIEPVYISANGAAPGPGMVNMFSDQAGSTLAWDLRSGQGAPGYGRVRILYQQTEAPLTVAVSVDGQAEQQVTLAEKPGPALLELAAERPLAQVRLRLLDGALRLHGLELLAAQPAPYTFDVFGYPGATVASWRNARQDYLASWFGPRDYQLVMLEFGTNEGNVKPFDGAAYRRMLVESVHNMRERFPGAACMLIAPGDRGVLVPRSANRPGKGKAKGKRKAGPKIDLRQYSRIHAEIGRIQAEVAAGAGCGAWSMMEAMGGPGSAYRWAQQTPALMARDLIHFTAAGYQRLARKFAQDMGWTTAGE